MLIMAVFAAVLGLIRPGQIINVFIAGFALYLVASDRAGGSAWQVRFPPTSDLRRVRW